MIPRKRRRVRDAIYRVLPERALVAWMFLRKGGSSELVHAHGWARSLRGKIPVDANGEPLPWIPYCAINLLEERLEPDFRVLEYGSGNSTLFFMKRVQSVTSIEHNSQWLDFVKRSAQSNVTLVGVPAEPPHAYAQPDAIKGNHYDLILVDGIHRTHAFAAAITMLTQRGVILLDDSDRPEYAPAFASAKAAGLRLLHFEGHKSASIGLFRSTLFYRDGNCLGI